jgi:ABC-type amino acid transport substrate-binding protein
VTSVWDNRWISGQLEKYRAPEYLFQAPGFPGPAAQKAGSIVVGTSTDPDYPPFEIAKGNSVHGFDIDLVKEIEKRMGYKMEVQSTALPLAGTSSWTSLTEGRI